MVKVGWSKCGLLRSFDPEFQENTMIQNMKLPLFKEDTNIQVDTSKNIEDEVIDVEESLEAIMEDTLSRVEKTLYLSWYNFHGFNPWNGKEKISLHATIFR